MEEAIQIICDIQGTTKCHTDFLLSINAFNRSTKKRENNVTPGGGDVCLCVIKRCQTCVTYNLNGPEGNRIDESGP